MIDRVLARKIREGQFMSQRGLANVAGLSLYKIGTMERGQRDVPDYEARAIALELGVEPHTIKNPYQTDLEDFTQ